MNPVFLTAEWRRLVILNFPIEAKHLEKYTPKGTEIDDWQGTAFVSLVGFWFMNTKVKGLAVPFHRNFEEVNLRFYVRSRGVEGWRRGVVFVREIVQRQVIASVARWIYNENFVTCPVRSAVVDSSVDEIGQVEYSWKHDGRWMSMGARFCGEPQLPPKNTHEDFIAERYWGYSAQRDGETLEYQVEHPPWKVWEASETIFGENVAGFYGFEFASTLSAGPSSAFIADGSHVIVRKGRRIAV